MNWAVAAAMLMVSQAAARDLIAVHGGWGAFRDPDHCYAIAQPVGRGAARGSFASVATWPRKALRQSLHVRLSRPRDRSAGVTLSVGERRFALVAGDRDAFAADAASDRAIVAALRSARSMSIEAVGPGGRPFADVYALTGFATAADAAAIACMGLRR
ncbi:MAG TPA: hypothetical protein VF695_10340 [Sphingomonas sp.]|jgi:hypothetical protein